jgi:hypothetical protein
MTWDLQIYFSCEGMLRVFIPLKNPSPWLGSNLRTLGPVSSTLTITPPRRLPHQNYCFPFPFRTKPKVLYCNAQTCCSCASTRSLYLTVETGWNSAPLIILVSLFYCFCEEILDSCRGTSSAWRRAMRFSPGAGK